MIRVVFFGTPEFCVPFLRAMAADPSVEIAAVVTRPDEEAGRGRRPVAPPVKRAAETMGIPVFQPATLRSNEALETLALAKADVFVVFAYGKLIPGNVLGIPPLGCVNVHPSLLPRYRGPSPMQSAIRNGDAETGITIMKLDEGMDTGPILASITVGIDENETLATLTRKVEEQGPSLLVDTLVRYAAGEIVPLPQDETRATACKLLTREDGHIDWTKSMAEIDRTVRAYSGWPGTWAVWNGMRLKIHEVSPSDFTADLAPGTVRAKDGRLFVDCADGTIELRIVHPEGKPAMTAGSFLNGYLAIDGATLA